jgi:hypothetical protein
LWTFVEDGVVDVDLAAGEAVMEIVRPRPVLREVNVLHVNHPKKLWTWIADACEVALGMLAVTGMFVLRGRTGSRVPVRG